MQNDSNILIEKSLYPNQLNKLKAVGYLNIEYEFKRKKYQNFLFLIPVFFPTNIVNPFPNIDSKIKTHSHIHT